MSKPHIALIGLGLIGSSLGHAFKKKELASHISGYARTAKTRNRALELNIVDSIHESTAATIVNADIIFINVPLQSYRDVVKSFKGTLKNGAIITDVGSVKGCTLGDVIPFLPEGVAFVPGHPIAGTEFSGPDAGFAELFENRWCILTPPLETSLQAVDKIASLWRAIGSEVSIMEAGHHDQILAITSHLPHLIAYNIVGVASSLEAETKREVIKYSASGFRDFTRIAASDPIMWRDVLLKNKTAVLAMIDRFSKELEKLSAAIENNNDNALETIFTETRAVRHSIIEAGQDTDEPNFGRDKRKNSRSK